MPQVKCTVSNCEYWAKGNNCQADEIAIEIDQHANVRFNEEFGSEIYGAEHQDVASDSTNTCCETFRPKEEE